MNKIERFQVEMSNATSEIIDYFIKRRGAGVSCARPSVATGEDLTPWGWARRRVTSSKRHQHHSAGGRCLVLLIIFMVVTPMLQKGIAVQLPETRPTRTRSPRTASRR